MKEQNALKTVYYINAKDVQEVKIKRGRLRVISPQHTEKFRSAGVLNKSGRGVWDDNYSIILHFFVIMASAGSP